MNELRKPFLVAAILCVLLCIAVETGSTLWKRTVPGADAAAAQVKGLTKGMDAETVKLMAGEPGQPARPGLAIPSLIFLDVLALFTVALIASPFVVSHRVTGKLQGCATFIFSLLLLIGGVMALFALIALTMLMAGLFMAIPFGTIAYLITWGFFDTSGAAATLGVLMVLKLGFAACMLLANQRFLKNKGLVLFLLTSLLATLIVQFLHSLVPLPLVSIADGIAAIIVVIIALVWLIFMLFGSVISVVKAIA